MFFYNAPTRTFVMRQIVSVSEIEMLCVGQKIVLSVQRVTNCDVVNDSEAMPSCYNSCQCSSIRQKYPACYMSVCLSL